MNNTEVVFENIEQRIIKEIENAHYAIFVSVAWFTNKKLFKALLDKAYNNCYVSIIIQLDDINSQSGINFNQIRIGRSECFSISKENELLHDKYCVIDFKTVITGSYNWTYKAANNSENIIILSDPSVASQYISRFEQLKAKYSRQDTKPESAQTKKYEIIERANEISHNTPTMPVLPKKQCHHCLKELNDNDNFCQYCGRQQKEIRIDRIIKCRYCNNIQKEPFLDAKKTNYCIKCGNTLSRNTNVLPPATSNNGSIIGLEIYKITCPICKTIYSGEYCPVCGLKKVIELYICGANARPEYHTFKEFQLCPKCKTPNHYGACFCRNCKENLTLRAMDIQSHEWIDLGLSVLWSTENLEGFYPWMHSKRKTNRGYNIDYNNDGQDIASLDWGHKWRTPTKEEFEELIEKCHWEKIVVPFFNKNAFKIIGPNGNHITLPVTGRYICAYAGYWKVIDQFNLCSYWTSTKYNERFSYCFNLHGYDSTKFIPKRTNSELYEDHIPSIFFRGITETDGPIDLDALYKHSQENKQKLINSQLSYKEVKENRESNTKRSNELWLNTPIIKEKFKISILPFPKEVGGTIRPVADLKWKGQL